MALRVLHRCPHTIVWVRVDFLGPYTPPPVLVRLSTGPTSPPPHLACLNSHGLLKPSDPTSWNLG